MIRLGLIAAAAAMLIAGSLAHAKMAMQTFPVLAGAGPHDVYPAPDGTVWFTAQSAGKLGRLDPRTGKSEAGRHGRCRANTAAACAPRGRATKD
jgi:virginiamycin B lyase